jgi:addiction module HigA family antidote
MARTPIHPGEILGDELEEIGPSSAELSRTLRVPPNRISQLFAGKRAITADTALRLARYFGTSADLWMNLQKTYELDLARKEAGEEIKDLEIEIRPPRTEQIALRLSKEDLDVLRSLAAARGVGHTTLARTVLEGWLARSRTKRKATGRRQVRRSA